MCFGQPAFCNFFGEKKKIARRVTWRVSSYMSYNICFCCSIDRNPNHSIDFDRICNGDTTSSPVDRSIEDIGSPYCSWRHYSLPVPFTSTWLEEIPLMVAPHSSMRFVTASLITLLVTLVSPAVVTSQSYYGPGSKCPRPARDDRRCRCIPVRDYEDLRGAILRMDDSECKCFEPFSVVKAPSAPPINMDNMRRVTVKCQELGQCEINGQGIHFLISQSEVTISGFRFVGATESAIVVMANTGSGQQDEREQLFCDNEFIK